jgi:sulfhydrogenase subunit beta (sulfur reductase)
MKTDGLIKFARIKSANDLDLDFSNTDESAKGILFPQYDTIFNFKNGEIKNESDRDKPIAIFGIRPCDARSFLILNKALNNGGVDDFYWNQRYTDAMIFTIGCNTPLQTCFCNWADRGPFNKEGTDIFLTDLGDDFMVESCSPKGDNFLKKLSKISLQNPDADDLQQVNQIIHEAQQLLSEKIDLSSLRATLNNLLRDSPLWSEISTKCLSCACCTYLCPTCHCFDIQDEKKPGTNQGSRIRMWDSCMFSLFTKEASGHNPRPTIASRMRQRIMHKFAYFVENFSEIACVGCGRCVRACPVNLDVREVIKRIKNEG